VKTRRRSHEHQGPAVFSRNHSKYLVAAAARSARAPGTRVTFRAEKKWVSVSQTLKRIGSIPIYFAVVGGRPRVEYVATLCDIRLDPRNGDSKTRELLRHSLPASAKEGLWETTRTKGRVRTLYAITDCKRLNRPFPIARLVKISDGAPLSSGYRYSYSVVRPVGAPSSDASVQRTASRDARRGR